jgi:nucleotide-binding universal stress UspA family protein
MKSIVVALDFPITSRKVLNMAKKFALEFKAKLHIMHSESIDSYFNHIVTEDNLQPSADLLNKYKTDYEKKMQSLYDELSSEKIDCNCILMEGPTVDNILKFSAEVEAEMIILGSHEHGNFYHLIMGSTHNLLIKKSTIPILIIPSHIID